MPTGGVVNTVNTSYLSNKDLDRVFAETMNRWPEEYTKYTKASSTGDRYIKEGEISTLGPLVEKPEGSIKTIEAMKQGNTKTVTFKTYSLAAVATQESRDFDKQGIIRRIPEFLAMSAAYSKEIQAADLFLSGFGTSRTGIDGLPLFDDSHVILDPWTGAASATYDNEMTAAALSASTLASARDYFEELANSKGLPVQAGRRILLVVGTGLRDTAKLLLENEYEVDSSDRNMNVNKDTMSYMVSHYLGATHTGYYVVDLDLMDLRHITSKQFSSKTWDDPWTDNMIYGITGRWTFDFISTYGVIGNAGA